MATSSDLFSRPRDLLDAPATSSGWGLGAASQTLGHASNRVVGMLAALTPSASQQWEAVGTSTRELTVQALDTIDGTLILDIKSYIPVLNQRDDVRVSEWVNLLGGRTSQDRDDRD